MMDAAHQHDPPPPPSYELAAAPTSTSTLSSSRPTLGFPLGTALLLLVIFCLSGVLSCCYHWDKIQALRRSRRRRGGGGGGEEGEPAAAAADEENGAVPAAGIPPPPYSKPTVTDQYAKQEMSESLLPVIMPGDRIPKFIAWPCPCDHLPAFAGAATPPTRATDVEPPPPPDDAHQLNKLTTAEDQGLLSLPPALQAPAPAVVPPHAALLCAAATPTAHDQEEPTLVVQLPYSNRPAAS